MDLQGGELFVGFEFVGHVEHYSFAFGNVFGTFETYQNLL